MKNYFLSVIMISISLLTFSCSKDDESTPATDFNAKGIVVTEANSVDGKSGNVEPEKSSRVELSPYSQSCYSNGYGNNPQEAKTNAWNKFRLHPCYNPNLPIDYYIIRHATRGYRCIAKHFLPTYTP